MSRRIIIDELEFEVPYGKLAAKTWHEEDENSKRVLALHGWMDNAGSFDNIIPHLKHEDGLYIVALDLPGHGKSSQLPPGSSYSDLNILLEIRRCLTDLNWIQRVEKVNNNNGEGGEGRLSDSASTNSMGEPVENRKKFSIIGHSLGAGLGLFYASLYPDDVEELISLDFFKARSPTPNALIESLAVTMDQFLATVPGQSPFSSPILSKTNPSTTNLNKSADKGQVIVSQETAIVATIQAHQQLGVLTRDDATCLLKRSTVAVSTPPNSVIYSRDLRLQSMLNLRENFEVHKVLFANLKCHVIFILGKQGLYANDGLFKDRMDQMEELYKSKAKSFYLHWFDGDHYLHMSKPKQTAEIINKYLKAPADYKVEV